MEGKFALVQFETNYFTEDLGRNAQVAALLDAAKEMSGSSESTEKLCAGVWLIDLRKDLPLLGRICEAAQSRKVPYRVLFLEEVSQWMTYSEWK